MSDDAKRLAGEAAAAEVETGMRLGLGTGSTAAWFVKALGTRVRDEGLKVVGVPTSEATAVLAREVGLSLATLEETRELDLTVDGADEIGPGLALIKGGGAALLREKLVWEASRRCLVIADRAKVVERLGAFPLPVEVIPFGHVQTANRLTDVLVDFELTAIPRLRLKDGRPVLTDQGNFVYDVPCGRIEAEDALAAAIKGLTGVVEHGLFLGLADEAIVGLENGVERLSP